MDVTHPARVQLGRDPVLAECVADHDPGYHPLFQVAIQMLPVCSSKWKINRSRPMEEQYTLTRGPTCE